MATSRKSRKIVTNDRFNGGISISSQDGTKGSFAFGQSINIHEDSSSFVALNKTAKESGSTVTGIVIDACRTPDGSTWFIDTDKKFYKRTSAASWSVIATLSADTNGCGIYYWAATDTIYITTNQSVTTYGPITGTPVLNDGLYGNILDQSVAISSIAYPSSTNIQAHYVMEETSAGADRSDTSGNSNTLTDSGTCGTSTTAKEGLRSASFTGSSYLSISNAAQTGLNITSSLSMAAWVQIGATGSLQTIMGKWEEGANRRQYRLYITAGNKLAMDISTDGTAVVTATGATSLSAGTWYHCAGIYTASGTPQIQVFLNNASDALNTTSIPASVFSSSGSFSIGADTLSSPQNRLTTSSLVDDALVYNKALSTSELTTIYTVPGNYSVPTSITEPSTFTFVPTVDPNISVKVNIANKGTGNWTVTIHDDNNAVMAAVTVANASLSTGVNTFTFSTNWRPVLGATYHIHVTSSVNDGTITPGTTAIQTFSARLVSSRSKVHPLMEFTNFLVMANERYLSIFDGILKAATDSSGSKTSSWTPHKVTLPSGYEITCVTRFNEYIVAGAEYYGTNPDDFSKGLLIFWDGTATTFNFFIEVLEGGVQLVLPIKNRLYFIAGIRGELFVTSGQDYLKVNRFPNTNQTQYVRTIFSSCTVHRGMPLFGLAYTTTNTLFKQGVYAWGHKQEPYPDVLTYDYPISTGTTTGTSMSIGAVKSFGSDLFIAWKDGSSYGVDKVDTTLPFATASWESMVYNYGTPYKRKEVGVLRADHDPIPTGGSVQIGYKLDGESSYHLSTANTNVGETFTRFPINLEANAFQFNCIISASSTSVKIQSVTWDVETAGYEEGPV